MTEALGSTGFILNNSDELPMRHAKFSIQKRQALGITRALRSSLNASDDLNHAINLGFRVVEMGAKAQMSLAFSVVAQ